MQTTPATVAVKKPASLHTALFCCVCGLAIDETAVLNIKAPAPGWIVLCKVGAWVHMVSSKDGVERLVYMVLFAAPGSQLANPLFILEDQKPLMELDK